jgi:hypothetical protein
MNYLRNKPFLVLTVYKTPARGVKTERKGWATVAENFDVKIVPNMKNRIKDNDLYYSTLIIDVLSRSLVKNRFSGTTEDKDIVDYYLSEYSDVVQSYLQQHQSLIPQTPVNLFA